MNARNTSSVNYLLVDNNWHNSENRLVFSAATFPNVFEILQCLRRSHVVLQCPNLRRRHARSRGNFSGSWELSPLKRRRSGGTGAHLGRWSFTISPSLNSNHFDTPKTKGITASSAAVQRHQECQGPQIYHIPIYTEQCLSMLFLQRVSYCLANVPNMLHIQELPYTRPFQTAQQTHVSILPGL